MRGTLAAASSLGLALVMAGCASSPLAPLAQPMSALAALSLVEEALPEVVNTKSLVYVKGFESPTDEAAFANADGNLVGWQFGYLDPVLMQTTTVDVDWSGQVTTFVNAYWSGLPMTVAPIDPALAVDSPGALQAAIANLADQVPPLSLGGSVKYWLAQSGGVPTWQVTVTFPGMAAAVTYVNAFTGAVVAPPGSSAITLATALAAANAALYPLATDIEVIEAAAVESPMGGFETMPFRYHEVEGVYMAPDLTAWDGKALGWAFIHWSASQGKSWPTVVYGGLAPVIGQPLTVPWDSSFYQAHVVDDLVVDSDAAIGATGVSLDLSGQYHLSQVQPHDPLWSFGVKTGDEVSQWRVNAASGVLVDCSDAC